MNYFLRNANSDFRHFWGWREQFSLFFLPPPQVPNDGFTSTTNPSSDAIRAGGKWPERRLPRRRKSEWKMPPALRITHSPLHQSQAS